MQLNWVFMYRRSRRIVQQVWCYVINFSWKSSKEPRYRLQLCRFYRW